jgi:hypothetical protein
MPKEYTMKRFYYTLIFSLLVTSSYSQAKVKEVSHYLFPEFNQGIILMKNGTKNRALLNYNSLTEEMIFKDKGNMLAVGEGELELVDTVFIKDRKFVTLNHKFVELLSHSNYDLYAEHKCKLLPPGKPAGYGGTSETSAITSASSINSGGRLYELKLPEDYEIIPYTFYWLRKNGELYEFISMKQLMKIYDDKKDLGKDYVKKHDVKYENQHSMAELIQYLETN